MQKSLQHLEELTISLSLYEDNILMKRLKVDSEKAHTLLMGYLQAVICLLRHSLNKHTQEAEAERILNYSTIAKTVLKNKIKIRNHTKNTKYRHVCETGCYSCYFRDSS